MKRNKIIYTVLLFFGILFLPSAASAGEVILDFAFGYNLAIGGEDSTAEHQALVRLSGGYRGTFWGAAAEQDIGFLISDAGYSYETSFMGATTLNIIGYLGADGFEAAFLVGLGGGYGDFGKGLAVKVGMDLMFSKGTFFQIGIGGRYIYIKAENASHAVNVGLIFRFLL